MSQPYGKTQIEIGRVISRTFATIGANFPTFILLSIIFGGIPAVIVGYVTQTMMLPALLASGDSTSYFSTIYLIQFGSTLVLWLPMYVLIGALTHGAVVYLSGDRASLASCLGTGFGRALPLLALGFLSAIGMAFFFLLLIVPGIMAAVRWSVAAPALVVERVGVMEAFGRSGDLTRGSRWSIFGLFVIWIIVAYIFQLCLSALFGFSLTSNLFDGSAIWAYFAITGVNAAVANMVAAAGSAALYTELREIKDGATSAELAKVFD